MDRADAPYRRYQETLFAMAGRRCATRSQSSLALRDVERMRFPWFATTLPRLTTTLGGGARHGARATSEVQAMRSAAARYAVRAGADPLKGAPPTPS